MKKIVILIILAILSEQLFSQSETDRFRFLKLDMSVVKLFHKGKPIGSGFVIKNFYIVTNFHLVEQIIESKKNKEEINDTIYYNPSLHNELESQDDRTRNPAFVLSNFFENDTIYNYGKYSDLVILKSPNNKNLTSYLPISRKNYFRGDDVIAAGFPLALQNLTISSGIVGNEFFGPFVPKEISSLIPFARPWYGQSDFINAPGSSGGPVIKLGNTKDKDSIVGIVWGGRKALNQDISSLLIFYEEKLNDIVSKKDTFNIDLPEHRELFEKYIILNSLKLSNTQIPIFTNVYHLRELLDLIGLEY
ncbi:S1 family peptidase [Confluentibacter lentus]|uniref:S1 family peptidase n=1 Tax=Confluentibacter lentus TaxID=1699412 RepID=UPI000C281EC4|nr:serine protease [Confluentibacter lentus]